MPSNPEHGGSVRLMTVTEIAEEYEISRQAIHDYRRRGIFPQPVQGEGSTRLRFRADEVREFFAANPKRPGKRTDLAPKQPGEPMDLTDFLRARVAEDEADAPNQKDPDRARREAEAKHRIVVHYAATARIRDEAAERIKAAGDAPAAEDLDTWNRAQREAAILEDVVRYLAMVYVDHPDYPAADGE